MEDRIMKNNFKYIFAVIAAALICGTASAQDWSSLKTDKKATTNSDGTTTITLESFVKGEMSGTTTDIHKNINAVLVLDVSGSMAESIGSMTKLQALKNSCKEFVNILYNDAVSHDAEHRVSVISFGYEIETKIHLSEGKVIDAKNDINDAIDKLNSRGWTGTDSAMDLAYTEVSSCSSNTLNLVILFTDGAPSVTGTIFNSLIAGPAVRTARQIKNKGAKVYAIGVFDSSDKKSTRINQFMNWTSSNYPNATVDDWWTNPKNVNNSDRADGNYFLTADTADDLKNIFETIGQEYKELASGSDIPASQMPVDKTLTVDEMTENFVLPSGMTASDVKVYTKAVDSVYFTPSVTNRQSTNYIWSSDSTLVTSGITVQIDTTSAKNKVAIKGYDYVNNWVGAVIQNNTIIGHHGQKLIVQFNVVPNPDSEGGMVYTNTTDSGVFVGDDNVSPFERPDSRFVPIDLVIKKQGMEAGESAIFKVTCKENDSINYTIILTSDGSADGVSKAILKVPAVKDPDVKGDKKNLYTYVVEETGWSWAYKPTASQNHALCDENGNTKDAQGNDMNVFTFVNTPKANIPLHAEDSKNNVFTK